MLERLGIANRQDLVVFACLLLLVALTPTGNEGTLPGILFIHRTLLLGIIAAYVAWTDRDKLRRLCPYYIGILAVILGIMLLSVIRWPGALFEGFYAFYTNLLFLAAFIALAHAGTARPARWKLAVLISVVVINLAYLGAAFWIPSPVLQGPFVNPNYMASFLLPGLAVCIAILFYHSSLGFRAAAAIGTLVLFFGISQTASRGATLAAVALFAIAGFRAARRYEISWVRIGVAAGLLASLVLGATIALNPTLAGKFLDRGERDPYNYQRVSIWMSTLSMIAEHPVMGVGLGHYYHFGKRFAPAVEGTIARRSRWPNIAHSEYLQDIAEIGVPGALLLFAAAGYLAWLAYRRATRLKMPEERIPQEAAILTLGALGIHALVDNNWTLPVMAAGMAVISQADLLPYRDGPRYSFQSPLWRTALAILLAAVWLDAAVIPSVGLHYNERGLQHFKAGDLVRAETDHRFALGFLPENPVLLDNLGSVYFARYFQARKSEDLDRAEIFFADALAQNPHYDLPAGHLEKALIERLNGDPRHDAPIHERIVEIDKRILEMTPFNPFVRKNLAEGLYNLGRREEACAELEKALENEPNYIPGYLRLAEWYAAMGREQQSSKYRNHAIQVANLYKDQRSLDEYENLLLGRPEAAQ